MGCRRERRVTPAPRQSARRHGRGGFGALLSALQARTRRRRIDGGSLSTRHSLVRREDEFAVIVATDVGRVDRTFDHEVPLEDVIWPARRRPSTGAQSHHAVTKLCTRWASEMIARSSTHGSHFGSASMSGSGSLPSRWYSFFSRIVHAGVAIVPPKGWERSPWAAPRSVVRKDGALPFCAVAQVSILPLDPVFLHSLLQLEAANTAIQGVRGRRESPTSLRQGPGHAHTA